MVEVSPELREKAARALWAIQNPAGDWDESLPEQYKNQARLDADAVFDAVGFASLREEVERLRALLLKTARDLDEANRGRADYAEELRRAARGQG